MTTQTKYNYQHLQRLQADRKARLDAAQHIVDQAKSEGRDLDAAETEAVVAVLRPLGVVQLDLTAA